MMMVCLRKEVGALPLPLSFKSATSYSSNNQATRASTATMQSSHTLVFGDPQRPVKLDDFRNVLIRYARACRRSVPAQT